ncbi:hypothetical protein Dimus_032393 [Dionaea muscipula]
MSSSTSIAETLTLIPGLPYDLSALILSHIPFSHHARLKSTCKSWRIFFSSKTLISLRSNSSLRLSHLICIFPDDPSITRPYVFDPLHVAWLPLPTMPINPHVYALCNFASISIGAHLYVLGGSVFDTRSFPLYHPCASSAGFRLDLVSLVWERISPMRTPRGSFACAAVRRSDQILVAGGGSRHTLFGAAGSRMRSVERYDIGKDEWFEMDGLPKLRAGCVGFMVGKGKGKAKDEEDFWVMGGYGEERTIDGVLPVDEYYKDAVVMELKGGRGRWREVGNTMWDGDRLRLGKIVVLEDEEDEGVRGVYMLSEDDILRYDMVLNRWLKECSVPRKVPPGFSFDFIALNQELHVMTFVQRIENPVLHIQIYHPKKKIWRSVVTHPPFRFRRDFQSVGMCTVRV